MLKPTGWGKLWYSETLQDVTASHPEWGQLAVGQLSDGIRNSIAMVADMAYRAVQLNPHLGAQAVKEARGVVLIDEVDMHLHPSWQQVVLVSLREAFPGIQFIVTTHSPQVLSTVKRENIRVIAPDANGRLIATPPLAMTYGEPSGDVLHSVMMVDPQPPVREKAALEQLTDWVDQGAYQSPEAQALLKDLASALSEQHPQLQRLRRSIQRQELLKR